MLGREELGDFCQDFSMGSHGIIEARRVNNCDAAYFFLIEENLNCVTSSSFCKFNKPVCARDVERSVAWLSLRL
jgi:hypothetical protein